MPPDITPDAFELARRRVAGIAVESPLVAARDLAAGGFLKLETVQPTGSFKVRGAASKIGSLSDEQRERGVVTASTGNHGRAVAHVASMSGVPATVCISTNVPPGKVKALEALGCRVERGGDSQSEALTQAQEMVAQDDATLVHPFDDTDVIAGQGTIGLEILDAIPDVADIVVPLSGGGLISGIASAVRSRGSQARVLGVTMERAPAMALSLDAGHPVYLAEEATLADSLQGGIGLDNRYTFDIVQRLVDHIVLLTEDEIWAGMQWAFTHRGVVLEGAGAVGIGAVLAGKIRLRSPAVIVCSGGNLELDHLLALGGQPAHNPRRSDDS